MRLRNRRLRFTREGRYFVVLTLGIGFAAINTGNNLLYLVLGTMLALIVGSGVLSELTLQQLQLARQTPARIFANRPFLVGIRLINEKRRMPTFSVEVEDVLAGGPLDRRCYFLKVPAGASQLASYRHTFAARGAYTLSELRLTTRFPFALFEKSRTIQVGATVVVYPEIHSVGGATGRRPSDGDEQGHRAGRRGEFRGLRDYRDGDDPRDIFWRKSAKVGRLLVREHEDPLGRRVTLFLDNRRLPGAADQGRDPREERAVSRAASLALHHLNHGRMVSLVGYGLRVDGGSGPAQLDRILRALALIEFIDSEPSELPVGLPADLVRIGSERPASPHVIT